MASERAKNLGKRIIDYPEGEPTVLSSKDWVQNLVKDPKDYVSYLFFSLPSSPLTSAIGRPLCHPTLPYFRLDYPVQ